MKPSARRSRIAHFKTPFVVSIAAPAAFGMACGAQTAATDGSGGTTAVMSSGGSAGSSNTCSGLAPQQASGCEYTCADGQWASTHVEDCNTPTPALNDCPALTPDLGASCAAYVSNLACFYGPACGPAAASRYCSPDTALWEGRDGGICNPPAPVCPSSIPPAGSDCAPEGQACNYPGCGNTPSSATCQSGQWLVVPSNACNPPLLIPVCPERERSAGDGCAYEGQECSYDACTGPTHDGLVCRAGQWQAVVLACAQADAGPDSGL
jgi:hypothetical protein